MCNGSGTNHPNLIPCDSPQRAEGNFKLTRRVDLHAQCTAAAAVALSVGRECRGGVCACVCACVCVCVCVMVYVEWWGTVVYCEYPAPERKAGPGGTLELNYNNKYSIDAGHLSINRM